ncbi:hypothetical protein CRG49_012850 [Neisseria sp. N95_16]|uniref:Uncharacterized protein n=1 Tax=Neisseria brasiliensis TaxID=2666100 RepID=A0A7X2KYT1_9NEIS|nr:MULTISPECIES: hypothetical protein [Neisseria]MRN38042.1 hypothetical protein [Neisseria brasiliensis]MRN38478.1 hypothetical protein [Neisseria brasiliensis]PJO08477.1 hypothetical protein CRG49_012850 [Neisseria sp. N95_16]
MYYQVGNKCLEQSQAENVYFSLVVPQITQHGQILQPQYNGSVWTLNGQTLKAALPQCSPTDNLKSGLETGWILFGVMAAVYFVSITKRLFQ